MTLDPWKIRNEKHDPYSLAQHNSVFTISNGYVGLKGTLAEDRDGQQPVTLINGLYDELDMFSLIRPSNRERRYLDAAKFDTAGKSPSDWGAARASSVESRAFSSSSREPAIRAARSSPFAHRCVENHAWFQMDRCSRHFR